MPKTTVLIADDHPVVREGLRSLLSAEPELHVAGEADTGTQAVALAAQLQPDVVLMDLVMPECSGAMAAQAISRHSPGSKVLFLSFYHDADSVRAAICSGAVGYLAKRTASQDVITAIREVLRGNTYFSSSIRQGLDSECRSAAGWSPTPSLVRDNPSV